MKHEQFVTFYIACALVFIYDATCDPQVPVRTFLTGKQRCYFTFNCYVKFKLIYFSHNRLKERQQLMLSAIHWESLEEP